MTPALMGYSIAPARHLPAVFAPGDQPSGAGADERPRVLVVEDDYLAAVALETGLAEAGFEVVGIAGSADEAVALARAERPTLAVMDIRLAGGRDGVDAALEMYRAGGIRCIFATAHHDPRTRARAEPAAPLGWVPKPYTLETVVAAIASALDELRQQRR